MTKTQVSHSAKISKNQPLNESRYTGFYLTLLILSTVGTAFSTLGLFSIIATLEDFNISPVYAVFSLINTLVVLPLAITALVLLWMKKALGIRLKLSAYALSIICAIGLLFSSAPILKSITTETLAEVAKTSSKSVSTAFIEGLISFALYGGLVFAIIISLVLSLLWYKAWKKQVEADSE